MNAFRTLLVDAIDYAGLFPPAQLGMAEAVREYAGYRSSVDAWALGRFIVPAARLGEFAEAARPALGQAAQGAWLLSATGGGDPDGDLRAIEAFAARVPADAARLDTVEFRAPTVEALGDALGLFPRTLARFAELPLGVDLVPFVALLKFRGAGAKFRTGGVTADAFPDPDALLAAMDAVLRAGVPFKCTAGLHHPVRGEYRLTYAPDSPRGLMYGYLNVILAAAALHQGRGMEVARAILLETDPSAFVAGEEDLAWRDVTFDRMLLRALRRRGMRSFGSCSFREPLDELAPVGAKAQP